MKVKGKNIVVTGGGNGVGRELVLKLIAGGANVFAIDINKQALDETRVISGNSEKLFTHIVDISDKEAVFKFAESIISKHKKIDGIINNAGIIQPFINLRELEFDRVERVMNINFNGTLYMTKAFLPYLIERPEAHIVNVSSMGGVFPVPGQSIYGASKAAVKLLSEGLNSELRNTNVKVTVVIPGGVATNIMNNSDISNKVENTEQASSLLLTPKKAAELIIVAMEKNKARAYIGKDCNLMNILYKISPSFVNNVMNRAMVGMKQ